MWINEWYNELDTPVVGYFVAFQIFEANYGDAVQLQRKLTRLEKSHGTDRLLKCIVTFLEWHDVVYANTFQKEYLAFYMQEMLPWLEQKLASSSVNEIVRKRKVEVLAAFAAQKQSTVVHPGEKTSLFHLLSFSESEKSDVASVKSEHTHNGCYKKTGVKYARRFLWEQALPNDEIVFEVYNTLSLEDTGEVFNPQTCCYSETAARGNSIPSQRAFVREICTYDESGIRIFLPDNGVPGHEILIPFPGQSGAEEWSDMRIETIYAKITAAYPLCKVWLTHTVFFGLTWRQG